MLTEKINATRTVKGNGETGGGVKTEIQGEIGRHRTSSQAPQGLPLIFLHLTLFCTMGTIHCSLFLFDWVFCCALTLVNGYYIYINGKAKNTLPLSIKDAVSKG